jgi:predicted neutral ceramidase superfamily lipid hydrolase
MPDSRHYITHYTKYFSKQAPNGGILAVVLLLIGALSGIAMSFAVHYQIIAQDYPGLLISGLSTGVLVISLPALLTIVFVKATNRRMRLKHAALATIIITVLYAVFLIADSVLFHFLGSMAVAYIVLLLANACAYGYWFLLGSLVMGRRRSSAAIAATQPVLNILFYLPLGSYILNFGAPLNITLIKLFAGMVVFLAAGNAFLYVVDRPVKRIMDTSGIKLAVSMLNQWLYDLTNDVRVIGKDAGVKRDLRVELLAIRGKGGYKAVFVDPDIHFGPFAGVGGSGGTVALGDLIVRCGGGAPFVMHGTETLEDNPISAAQVGIIGKQIAAFLSDRGIRPRKAWGDFAVGQKNGCRALNVSVGDSNLILLTRAPEVTEDMGRDLGLRFRAIAADAGRRSVMFVDAHNSRFESAKSEELEEVHLGNPHVREYESAIRESIAADGGRGRIAFGSSCNKLRKLVGNPKDMGDGYTSACVFGFGDRRFGIVHFDSNNMLPGFRSKIVGHLREKFGIEVEVSTTDTHSTNSLGLSASNSLGRHASIEKVMPLVDDLVQGAISGMEPASYSYRSIRIGNFAVWGKDADALIERTSREVKRILKYVVPALVIATFIIAAWVIYIV